MIACPLCGSSTSVSETRTVGPERVRRRRACDSVTCGGRVTTVEVPISDGSHGRQGALAVIPKRVLEDAHRALEQAIALSRGDS